LPKNERMLCAALMMATFVLLRPPVLPARGAAASAPPRPGEILYAARAITVRTRGGGNLAVDLPRGRALQMIGMRGEIALLEPIPADADLLRQFGVRKLPRYAVPRAELDAAFLDRGSWMAAREHELARLRERWPGTVPGAIERIFAGEPFPGMSLDQAEEAVGALIFSRDRRSAAEGDEELWKIGRRSRSAELRQWSESRERGIRARTFEEYLDLKTRAALRFRGGILIAIETPTPGG